MLKRKREILSIAIKRRILTRAETKVLEFGIKDPKGFMFYKSSPCIKIQALWITKWNKIRIIIILVVLVCSPKFKITKNSV